MQEFKSQKIIDLVEASKSLWNICLKSSLKVLEQPSAHPEFTHLYEKLTHVSFDDFSGHSDFKTKLFVTNSADYFDIYKDESIHIMAIFMPPKLVYPIHDHPEMLVYSKVLKGKAIVTYYDIIEKEHFYKNLAKLNFSKLLAKLSHSVCVQENEIECLLPHKGNLHSIESLHRTVILDVMFNYYDEEERECSFFELGAPKGEDLFEMFYHREDF